MKANQKKHQRGNVLFYRLPRSWKSSLILIKANLYNVWWRGLEAPIKSVKWHLFRVVPNQTFSRSELFFLLVHTEGCMNLPPLFPLSANSGCCDALIPAHFLIGRLMTACPVNDVPGPTSLRARWHELQSALSDFWRRWVTEYHNCRQQQPKWRIALQNLVVSDVVVIRQPTAPAAWWLRRVVEVYPGSDGLVSVARVQLSNGRVFDRSVCSLVPLVNSP